MFLLLFLALSGTDWEGDENGSAAALTAHVGMLLLTASPFVAPQKQSLRRKM
jgi:hypothetical protein